MTMFNWFPSSCPVDSVTRDWIECRWKWLGEQFGDDRTTRLPIILPTAEYFPDPYDRTETAGRTLLDRVCGFMGADPKTIQLKFFFDKRQFSFVNEQGRTIAGAVGTYRKGDSHFVVRIERSQLEYPMQLVGTMAHELAHVRLLGEGRLERNSFDNEILTDLTVVFHGLGIFLANYPSHWSGHSSIWPDTVIPKPEYMTTPMYGYAMAYQCWRRGDSLVKWCRHLRSGIRSEFNQAMRFLKQLEENQRQ